MNWPHLARRLAGSLRVVPLSDAERSWAAAILSVEEDRLFGRLAVVDQRHALEVLARFDSLAPAAPIAARRAALLHDIGKVGVPHGVCWRVAATLLGPRTASFRRYHDHERIGLEMLVAADSDPETIDLLRGTGDQSIVLALRRADEI